MKINGFGMSRTQETLRKDQDKQTKEKNSTTKPQGKADTYSISPEAKAKMEEVAKQQQKVGEKPEEPQQGKGKLNNHVSELRSASEDGLVLTAEQISAYSSGVEESELLTSNPNYDLYGVLGPKQDIEGSYTGDYANNSWETTFPPHNPPEFSFTGEGFDNFMAYNQSVRDDISDSISKLLKDNNVVIPEGVEFDISVDPYDYKIHVTGVDGQTLDPELEKQIEDALNKGDNGKNLYEHIDYVNYQFLLSRPGWTPSGETESSYLQPQVNAWGSEYNEGYEKLHLVNFIQDNTGYSFDELEHRDGEWYTPDGENAWAKASTEYIKKFSSEDLYFASEYVGKVAGLYQKVAENGLDALEDRNLSITYSGGNLSDYGTAQGIGEGQKDWVEDFRAETIIAGEMWNEMIAYVEERNKGNESKPNNFNEDLSDDWEERFMELVRADMGKNSTTSGEVTSVEELLKQLMNNGNTQQQTLLDTLLSNKS
ncbi:MAG: DUF4885 family protein [Eubacteriales bacterium]